MGRVDTGGVTENKVMSLIALITDFVVEGAREVLGGAPEPSGEAPSPGADRGFRPALSRRATTPGTGRSLRADLEWGGQRFSPA